MQLFSRHGWRIIINPALQGEMAGPFAEFRVPPQAGLALSSATFLNARVCLHAALAAFKAWATTSGVMIVSPNTLTEHAKRGQTNSNDCG